MDFQLACNQTLHKHDSHLQFNQKPEILSDLFIEISLIPTAQITEQQTEPLKVIKPENYLKVGGFENLWQTE